MELVNLRMLADTRLLPSLHSNGLGIACKGSVTSGAFLFLAKPGLSITEVRQVYGQPQSAKLHGNGQGFEALTYGRFRILFGKDGSAVAVVFKVDPFVKTNFGPQ